MILDFGNLEGAKGYALNVLIVALQDLDKVVPLGVVKIWYDQKHDFHNATFFVNGDQFLLQKYKRITFWKNPIPFDDTVCGFQETHPRMGWNYDGVGGDLQLIFATDRHTYGPLQWPACWPPKKQWTDDPRLVSIIVG